MIMEVILNARTGGATEIHADIEAVRGEALDQNALGESQRTAELGMFFDCQAGEVGGMSRGNDHQMTAGVGIEIHHEEAALKAVQDQMFAVIGIGQHLAEDAGVAGIILNSRFNVLHSPWRPETFQGFSPLLFLRRIRR